MQNVAPEEVPQGDKRLAPAVCEVVLAQLDGHCALPGHGQEVLRMLPPLQRWPVSHAPCMSARPEPCSL